MSRVMQIAVIVLLSQSGARLLMANDDGGASPTRLNNGLISFGHDPDCPGCRAFLAGYGTSAAIHSPSCACGAGAGAGAGDAGLGDSGAGAQLADDYQDLIASDSGAALGYESAAPGMVGDFFGGSYRIAFSNSSGPGAPRFSDVAVAGGDRRFKLAENNSPFPVDRVFVNYNHFHNSLTTVDGRDANLNRGVAGFEKTFLDSWWSVEFRMPFSSGLNEDQILNQTDANNVSGSLGNIAFALKRLLFRTNRLAGAAGVGVVVPTGSDGRYFDAQVSVQDPIVTIENTAYYFLPFAGLWWTPNDQFFAQFVVQGDIDARGNEVFVNSNGPGRAGVIQDQTLLFLDASFGYWLFRDRSGDRILTGIAPMIEIHHTTTLKNTDTVAIGFSDLITNNDNRLDVLNLTGAIRCELNGQSYLTFAGMTPLRGQADKQFDAEFSVQFTRFF